MEVIQLVFWFWEETKIVGTDLKKDLGTDSWLFLLSVLLVAFPDQGQVLPADWLLKIVVHFVSPNINWKLHNRDRNRGDKKSWGR